MTTICCVCHRTKSQVGWVKKRVSKRQHRLSHGYCPDCYRQTMEMIQLDYLQRRGRYAVCAGVE